MVMRCLLFAAVIVLPWNVYRWYLLPSSSSVEFTDRFVQLGDLRVDTSRSVECVLTNNSDESIENIQVQKSCGCIEVSVSHKHLKKGSSARVLITVAAGSLVGARTALIQATYTKEDSGGVASSDGVASVMLGFNVVD